MMARRKFYVTFGPYNNILLAENEFRACILTFRKYFSEDNYRDILPGYFTVSEKGIAEDDEDFIYDESSNRIETSLIINLLMTAGQEVKDDN